MREIKFRAFVKRTESTPDLNTMRYEDNATIFQWDNDGVTMEIMQWTGLQDKNGKWIYEGDIVFYSLPGEKPEDEKTQYTEAVSFIDGCFCVDGYTPVSVTADWEVEVIGNIYENASLLLPKLL